MVGYQAVQQAYAKRRRPFRRQRPILRAPGHPGDVEMRPGLIVHEALDELRRRDGSGRAAADILHVGDLRPQLFVVVVVQWHAPDFLADGETRRGQSLTKRVVVTEHSGMLMAEADDDR